MSPTVLSLCDYSCVMVNPWLKAGYSCICVDIKHDRKEVVHGNLTKVHADIRYWLPPVLEYAIVFAFPPCTNLAVSGRAHFKNKGLRGLLDGLELVERCRAICEWCGAPWMLENPVSTLSTYWRPCDYSFQPYEYGGYLQDGGDHYSKRTCLWTSDDFKMPDKKPVENTEGSRYQKMGECKRRKSEREMTPQGFAQAVFEANHKKVDGPCEN